MSDQIDVAAIWRELGSLREASDLGKQDRQQFFKLFSEIKDSLNAGNVRMSNIENDVSRVAEAASSFTKALEEHMVREEASFREIRDVMRIKVGELAEGAADREKRIKVLESAHSHHDLRLTEIDHPEEGRLKKVEAVTENIHAVAKSAKLAGRVATIIAALGAGWATLKSLGHI